VTRILILALCVLAGQASVVSAHAQLPLTAEDAKKTTPLFDAPSSDSLKCVITPWRPVLDFTFRFVTGYIAHCQLAQFDGAKNTIVIYLRVTPESKPAALFGSAYRIPELTPEMRKSMGDKFRKMKNEIGMSGAVGVGKGRYLVEVLIRDDRNRTYHKRWRVKVDTSRSERSVPLALQALSVESLDRRIWQDVHPSRNGLRLTLLLDAAPINPYQARLRAWDRAFLLQFVYSLLEQTPHTSVHLVAFNLDQQEEIFRSDHFAPATFPELSRVLSATETTTVSVQALKNRNSPEFLAKLANQELAADRADAIIFLGPNARTNIKANAAALTNRKSGSPQLFYFEYFPWPAEFADAIQSLVKAADGATYKIHDPAQLDQSIQKMLTELKQN
jgi:hypothetical protein